MLDVAKYIATTVVLSSVFGEIDTWLMYVSATVAIVVSRYDGPCFVTGRPVFPERNNENNNESNNDDSNT